ncbi:MAG: energy-coupled thiamine transporter ThiT [Lachnospiraceae bacterium]|nr:energy-coupled thiamine transporter ThiT [Lachnospiraceae bacterium]
MFFNYVEEDGAYALTTGGYVLSIIIMVAVFVIGIIIAGRRAKITTRQLTFSAVSLALAFVLSYIKIVQMPWGGAVTLLSMLFVTVVGYFYGPSVGFIAAFAYSMLEFIQDGGAYMLSPVQVCMDYLFAFTALGVSGFFSKKKNGLLTGYICAILLRGLFHSIGGYMFWMDYMPEDFPASLSAIYPIVYNYSYILAEGVITVIVISIPAVKKAVETVTRQARGE